MPMVGGRDALARAREDLRRDRVRAAIRHCWDAALDGASRNDPAMLADAQAVATAAGERATGKDARQATMLVRYCAEALVDAREGVEPRTVWSGLLSFGRERAKTCPDCAEKVKAAARVCRFCGYRFDAE